MKERNWSLDEARKIMQDSMDKPFFLYSRVSREIAEAEMRNLSRITNQEAK